MKIFPARFHFIFFLLLTSCESPRLVFPDIDYGIVVDSTALTLFTSGKRDSLSILVPGDRIVSPDTVVTLFSQDDEIRLSALTTTRDIVSGGVEIGNETITTMTDHFIIYRSGAGIMPKRSRTEIGLASGENRVINWSETK